MKRICILLGLIATLGLTALTGSAAAAEPFSGGRPSPLIKPLYTGGQAEKRAGEWARYDWHDGRAYTIACYGTGKNKKGVTQWECEGSWSSGEYSEFLWIIGIDPYGSQVYADF